MQEPSYLDKIAQVSLRFRMVLAQIIDGIGPNNNSDTRRLSHLDIPTQCQYLTGITNLMSTGRFFDTTIDVDY